MLGNSYAVGLDITEVGLRANAMGTAYTGVADDASAIYWNPAGLAQIEDDNINAEMEIQFLHPTMSYEDPSSKNYDTKDNVIFPVGFAAYKIGDIAFGTGFYVPYATGSINFNDVPYLSSLTGQAGTADIQAEMGFYAFGFSLAYQIIPTLSIGVTAEAIYGMSDTQINATTAGGAISEDSDMNFKGWAGYRYAVGLLLKPVDNLNIGLQMKSKSNLTLKGDFSLNVDMPIPGGDIIIDDNNAEFKEKLPWEFNGGIAYKISPELLISLDGAYKMWGGADKKTIETDAANVDVSTKDKDNYSVAVGIEDVVLPNLKLRGGIFYISECSDEEDIGYLNILNTAVFSFRTGIAYNVLPKLEICADLAYAYAANSLGAENDTGEYGSNTWTALVGIRYSK